MGNMIYERINAKQFAGLAKTYDHEFADQVHTFLSAGGLIPVRRKDGSEGLYVYDASRDPEDEDAYVRISWDAAVREAAEIANCLLDHYTKLICDRSRKSTATRKSDWRNAQTAKRAVMIFRDRKALMM